MRIVPTRIVSALASANNFSHPENRWPVLHWIGGEMVYTYRYTCTHPFGIYVYGVFSYFVPGGNIYLLRSRI